MVKWTNDELWSIRNRN